jgi:hypothetical protein
MTELKEDVKIATEKGYFTSSGGEIKFVQEVALDAPFWLYSKKNKFVDWEGPQNLFKLIEKDEDDQFKLKVSKKEKIAHDTYIFELDFPNPMWIAGLWPGGHYVWHAEVDGKKINRKYTPISPVNFKGKSTFVIKIYRENPDFPDGGKFT